MIRRQISRLSLRGKLGNVVIEQRNIKADFDFVVQIIDAVMIVIGYTDWPTLVTTRGVRFQSLNEDDTYHETNNGRICQDDVWHDKCSESTTNFTIMPHVLQLVYLDLDGEDLNLKKVDPRHFNRKMENDMNITLSKNSRLTGRLNVSRLNVMACDKASLHTKNEYVGENGQTMTERWVLDRARISLRGFASVVGLRVNIQLVVTIPVRNDVNSCACDVVANNACKVSYMGANPSVNPNIFVLRQVDSSLITPQPSLPSSSSSSSSSSSNSIYIGSTDDESDSDSDSDSDQSWIVSDGEVEYEENYSGDDEEIPQAVMDASNDSRLSELQRPPKKKEVHFKMTSQISSTVIDKEVKSEDVIACIGCMHNVAIFIATPCGCPFSCLSCLDTFQRMTGNCPNCRCKIKSAVFSRVAYNTKNESFILTGSPSHDIPIADMPDAPECKVCLNKVAQVILSCSHKVMCLFCVQTALHRSSPVCPLKDCKKTIISAIVVPPIPSPNPLV